MLQAVLFDLDGTLLQVNTDEFMSAYIKAITTAAAPVVEPGRFVQSLLASTSVMMQNRAQAQTNAEAFWADFNLRLGKTTAELKPLLDNFYTHQFNNLSRVTRPGDKARQAVQKTLDLGLRIVLATNPLFPESAIRDRMNWAGIGDLPWELVTSYEYMHSSKPHPEYYLEIAAQIALKPEHCLMVGNDMQKDIEPASAVGMRTFLVTDYLINHATGATRSDGFGNLSDLILWLDTMPR
ncbi:MAG: hypothetical protein JL56_11440 [Desulfotomaculum sp. BICA1-6]|nr:MAG: hypothetical protein JL56_11440 [Desulfotomaculum sp. BICA1-6]